MFFNKVKVGVCFSSHGPDSHEVVEERRGPCEHFKWGAKTDLGRTGIITGPHVITLDGSELIIVFFEIDTIHLFASSQASWHIFRMPIMLCRNAT